MTKVGQRERATQRRVVALFRDELKYDYLGDWHERSSGNIEEDYLFAWLESRGHSSDVIRRVISQIRTAAAIGGSRDLFEANRDFYSLLRYGVHIAVEVGEHREKVHLIDWDHPEANHFGIAEEVTVVGPQNKKRPDLVLYVNGIALAVIELKRSKVDVSEGIRQNLDNQSKEFIRQFFTTMQFVFAGNDTQGLRYGTIETPEKFALEWKDDTEHANPLDRALVGMCTKARFLELIHDYVVFDAGIKKVCRHNQYFGVRAAQERVMQREGGVIWHTQGSGKSLTMVWLAKWIRENITNSRILIVTDRDELDKQIEKVFLGVNESIYRAKSGAALVDALNTNQHALVCSLIHKFGRSEEGDIDEFLKDVKKHLPAGFSPKGEIFVFVDECHRTQSGKLHRALKEILPNAVLIGFTGTPLLSRDKQKSIETFGPYIHTYKYKDAVRDKVVLDLRYEARDIKQKLSSPKKVDKWFESKTSGLTEVGKAQLKKRWGTMQSVLSAKSRLEQIVADISLDMTTRPRLSTGHGNAILISDSIYNACRFFDLFQETELAGKCAIVTSYEPSASSIKGEATGEGTTQMLAQYNTYRKMIATYLGVSEDDAANRAEAFEEAVKKQFIDEPGKMKLLIVVDKLLTGFDAPPATYLYIDKSMKDHGLFQAICRVNRLDEDKDYGYIIDYKDLFHSLEDAFTDYAGEGGAFDGYDKSDVEGLLKNRLVSAKQRLDEALEDIHELCDPVIEKDTSAYLAYFNTPENATEEQTLTAERKRVELYKKAAQLARAYAEIASEMGEAGYSESEIARIRSDVEHYTSVAEEVRLGSGDSIDMKLYEPGMRQLLDQYVSAKDSKTLTTFDEKSLVELLATDGPEAVEKLPDGIKKSEEAVAETITQNVRKVIVEETAVNPKYYAEMSRLLADLIQERNNGAKDYAAYLKAVAKLAKQVVEGPQGSAYPASITTKPLQSLFDNLDQDEDLAVRVNKAILENRQDGWRGNSMKQKKIRRAIREVVGDDDKADVIFDLAANQIDY